MKGIALFFCGLGFVLTGAAAFAVPPAPGTAVNAVQRAQSSIGAAPALPGSQGDIDQIVQGVMQQTSEESSKELKDTAEEMKKKNEQKKKMRELKQQMKNKKDKASELSGEQFELQSAMERKKQLESMQSDVMKKYDDTQNSISNNLK